MAVPGTRALDRFTDRQTAVLAAGVAAVLAAAVYLNALDNPFVFDDDLEILQNPSIEHLTNFLFVFRFSITRPVVNFSYALDYALWGGRSAFGYHVTNLFLHVLNVVLLFALARYRARDRGQPGPGASSAGPTLTAFTVASVFAVHPLLTEAVGYVSSRSDLLCASFFLTSMLCFRRAFVGSGARWLAGGLAAFVLAMGTKETAAMLPFVLLAYDGLVLRNVGSTKARVWPVHLTLVISVLAAGIGRVWLYLAVEHPDATRFQWQNVLVVLHVVARYLTLLVAPVSQSLIPAVYPILTFSDSRAVAAVGLIALMSTIAVLEHRREPLVTFGIVWFLVLLLPSSLLVLVADKGAPMAEHRVYLASCGFFMAVGALVARLAGSEETTANRRRRPALVVALCAVLAVLSGLTVSRNRVWADPVRLWADAVEKAPRTWEAVYGLADAYRTTGDQTAAEATYQRAIALRPGLVKGYLGLAGSLLDTGRVEQASEVLRLAIARVPSDTKARLLLAALDEESLHDPGGALRLCQEVLAFVPAMAEARECVRRNQQKLSTPQR